MKKLKSKKTLEEVLQVAGKTMKVHMIELDKLEKRISDIIDEHGNWILQHTGIKIKDSGFQLKGIMLKKYASLMPYNVCNMNDDEIKEDMLRYADAEDKKNATIYSKVKKPLGMNRKAVLKEAHFKNGGILTTPEVHLLAIDNGWDEKGMANIYGDIKDKLQEELKGLK